MSSLSAIQTGLVSVTARSALLIKAHSPAILTGVGIAAGITATILACRATLKVEPVVDEFQNDLKSINECEGLGVYRNDPVKNIIRDRFRAFGRASWRLTKLYSPAIVAGLISVGCLVQGHRLLNARNASLVAAYKVLEGTFDKYREKTKEAVGEDREQEIFYATERELASESSTGVNDEGEAVPVVPLPDEYTTYARFFDELSPKWNEDAALNVMFIKAQQNHANDILLSRGHLFLNEVYDMIGVPRTSAGAVMGWVVEEGKDLPVVDFGLYRGDIERKRAFVNGIEPAVLLDFEGLSLIFDRI